MKRDQQETSREPTVLETRPAMTVPSQNLVTWTNDADLENPSPLASSMIAPATALISRDLKNDSDTFSVLVVTFFILGYVFGSLLFGRLSEIYGRRPILLASNFIFSIWQLGCALSTSIKMQMAFRLLAGFGGSGCIAIGGGVISDVFDLKERGLAVTVFSVGPLVGPVLGPIVGAYISQDLGWRAIYYFMFITSMIAEIVTFFVVKESNPQTVLCQKRDRLQKLTSTPLFLENELSAISSKSPIYDLLISTILPWKYIKSGIMGLMVPLSFFWYGWAADKQVHWAVPVVGLLPFGVGLIGVFLPIQNYMIEAFPEVSASATAVLASSRNVVGTFLPIVAPSMCKMLTHFLYFLKYLPTLIKN
ncbi:MFS general substrate transporter [Didymella exigua CBS 183.55]|uniref:MFS general substrate transporter n=1 Tax=Didymella exigua CBS 183.55 TaxID=1150837 RepID=A0A6A5S3U6_9PLEO|nr:MFS general substrate transporter [Didymella exigua CBS 183.55]KAF1934439.1 MFS general substrate transporter [Didymella exigua CBS 183.55]